MSLLHRVIHLVVSPVLPVTLVTATLAPSREIQSQGRTIAPEQAGRFTQFVLGRGTVSPQAIAVDSRDQLWVSLAGPNAIRAPLFR
jgi:hypothetical protein